MRAALQPEKAGGGGLDLYAFCVALEEIAAEEAGLAATLLGHNAAIYPMAMGEREGVAVEVGMDSFPACLAYPGKVLLSGGKVNGQVPFAFNAGWASSFTLLPSGGAGTQAVTLRAGTEGLDVTPDAYPLGLRAARPGSIRLNSAEPAGIISGGNLVEEVERALFLGVASIAIGITRNSLRKAHAYACERYQGGKIIIEHQQMRIFLAEMLAGVEQGRAAVRSACESAGLAPAIAAWLLATERAVKSAIDGVQVHGGYGYMRDYGMERLMRDAKYCQMYPTTSQEALLRMMEMSEAE
jgi:alkylation response protein AidB-like acyl-CoA dehydrogenase